MKSIREIFTLTLLSFLAVIISSDAVAEYASGLTIARVRVHQGAAYFGATGQPANTCSLWGEYFKFDSTTIDGKNFLATLLAAKATGKLASVWYNASTAAGANQSNGCNESTISILTGISLD